MYTILNFKLNNIVKVILIFLLLYPSSYILTYTKHAYKNGAKGLNVKKYHESEIVNFLKKKNFFTLFSLYRQVTKLYVLLMKVVHVYKMSYKRILYGAVIG